MPLHLVQFITMASNDLNLKHKLIAKGINVEPGAKKVYYCWKFEISK